MSVARRIAWAAGAAVGAMGAYAFLIEPNRLELTRPRVHIRDLPPQLEGLRIGLLTDLHAGPLMPLSRIRSAASLLMDMQPHLIALTGDIADRHAADFGPAMAALRGLWAPLGVFAVPGNHDHLAGIAEWHAAMARSGNVIDLTNRYTMREADGIRLCIAGVDDLEEGQPTLRLPAPAERDLTILLAHQPDQAERARRSIDSVDLVLAGHTHAGQVRVPGVGPVERKSSIYDEGLRRRPWTQVYTSRGVGTTLLPLRLGARPEVAVLELTSRPRSRW